VDPAFRPTLTNRAFSEGAGPVVCIDESHNNFHTAEGTYAPFADVLQKDGYVVRPFRERAHRVGVSPCEILVIADAQPPQQTGDPPTFDGQEVAALNEWVREGGALFLITDHMPDPDPIRELAASFGIEVHDGYVLNGAPAGPERPILFRREDGTLASDPLTEAMEGEGGLQQVATFSGSAFRVARRLDSGEGGMGEAGSDEPPFRPILILGPGRESWAPEEYWVFDEATERIDVSGWFQGGVREWGAGRLALFSEAAMFTAQVFDGGRTLAGMNAPEAQDNVRLLRRVMRWLGAVRGFRSEESPLPEREGEVTQCRPRAEFLFDRGPFSSVHASTIVETSVGLVAAWFGGSSEGAEDVGVWLSRQAESRWTSPVEVATGTQMDGKEYPSWNPVLFRLPNGVVILFYKVGPSPQSWWGMFRTSGDDGRTWSEAKRLPDGILGPIKNKPVQLSHGVIISPSSTESPESPSRWRIHFERSVDAGESWTVSSPPPSLDTAEVDAIQPSILIHSGERLEALGRTRSGRVFETWSEDRGIHWSPIRLTELPNPNAGLDAVTLRDGRHLMVYNHTEHGRSPLNVSLSADGVTWEAALVLEDAPGEYSYPAVIQTSNGMVHITYTWRRERIKHVVVDPACLTSIPMPDGHWPPEIR